VTRKNSRFEWARNRMVEKDIEGRGIRDERVLDAMRKVPRHLFIQGHLKSRAYEDFPLPIGEGQTISQPYMVALMTQALKLAGTESVLEIGTGSGYQTAILAELCERVYSVERIPSLAGSSRNVLDSLGYKNILVRLSDGTLGWEEHAPYDRILVTAGSPGIPMPLTQQLKEGGMMVIPVGGDYSQTLTRMTLEKDGHLKEEKMDGCIFVKLVGRHGWEENEK